MLSPFPHIKKYSENGPERSRARRGSRCLWGSCAAQWTLDGNRYAMSRRMERGALGPPSSSARGNDPPCAGEVSRQLSKDVPVTELNQMGPRVRSARSKVC